jgi:hypothetical protein
MSKTFLPIKAMAEATLMDVVVLPTPPFWFVMAMIKRLSPFLAMAGEVFIDHEKKKSKGTTKNNSLRSSGSSRRPQNENVGAPTILLILINTSIYMAIL